MRRRKLHGILLLTLSLTLTSCASISGRREFAQKATSGATPILQEYQAYITKDSSLNDNEKKMREMLVSEYKLLLQEGAK